jgi:2-phosphosulfolactate phosphatase
MKIEVVATAQQVSEKLTEGKSVVVIDVLRATSVITTALMNGSGAVFPVETIDEAEILFKSFDTGTALRGGERAGKKIAGFEVGNSPLSYTSGIVSGKSIIITTTNGTKAIRNSQHANSLYIVCFLNLVYASRLLAAKVNDLVIVCSGTNGNFSLDDALCAGMLIDEIGKHTEIKTNDLGQIVRSFYWQEGSIPEKLRNCTHLNYLLSIGYNADVDYCLQTHVYDCLPQLRSGGFITL